MQKAKRSLKRAGFSLPPPRSSGRHCTYLVLKSSAASLALSICKTMLAFSTVAARICEGKKKKREKKELKCHSITCMLLSEFLFRSAAAQNRLPLGWTFHGDCREKQDALLNPSLARIWSCEGTGTRTCRSLFPAGAASPDTPAVLGVLAVPWATSGSTERPSREGR